MRRSLLHAHSHRELAALRHLSTATASGCRDNGRTLLVNLDATCRSQGTNFAWSEPEVGMTTTKMSAPLGEDRTETRIHQANVPEGIRSPKAQAGFMTSLDWSAAYLPTL